eukprot:2717872-Pyramimonas_sp.AAC.1
MFTLHEKRSEQTAVFSILIAKVRAPVMLWLPQRQPVGALVGRQVGQNNIIEGVRIDGPLSSQLQRGSDLAQKQCTVDLRLAHASLANYIQKKLPQHWGETHQLRRAPIRAKLLVARKNAARVRIAARKPPLLHVHVHGLTTEVIFSEGVLQCRQLVSKHAVAEIHACIDVYPARAGFQILEFTLVAYHVALGQFLQPGQHALQLSISVLRVLCGV